VLPAVCAAAATIVWFGQFDRDLFLATQTLTRLLPDALWAFVTDQAGLLSLAAWATLLLVVRPAMSTAILLACPAGLVFVRGLKYLIDAQRPQQMLPADAIHVIGREVSALSFPSGHTAAGFAVTSAVLYMLPATVRRVWMIPAVVIAGVLGLSRIAVGAHWPVDVLGGAALGWLVGLTGVFAARRWPLWMTKPGMLGLGATGMAAGIARMRMSSGYPSAEPFAHLLGLVAVTIAVAVVIRTMRQRT